VVGGPRSIWGCGVAVFISVLEGDSPGTAEPVVVTGDERVVRAVREALGELLGGSTPPAVLPLRRTARDGER